MTRARLTKSAIARFAGRYSRAYLRHLYSAGEFLAIILNTHHNIHFYLDIMRKIREAIRFGKLEKFRSDLQARLI